MKLYEMAAEYEKFMADVEAGIVPDEAIEDTLEAILGDIEVKADNIACIIKGIDADISAIVTEKARLEAREKALKSRAKRLKNYLSAALTKSGITQVETARNKISFKKSEAVEILDEDRFLAWAKQYRDDLLRYKEPEIDKVAVKKAASSGDVIKWIKIDVRQNIQIK